MNKYCVPLFIFLLPAIRGQSLEKEIQQINSLLSAEEIQEARRKTEDLLTVHPGQPALKYLLAFCLAEDSELEVKKESARLALEVVSNPSVSSSLYGNAANLALTVAHNSDSEELILQASEQVVLRSRERPLVGEEGEESLVFGLTLLGEQLLAGGEMERAEEILLPETGRSNVALGLLQLLVLRLKERKEGGGDRSLSDAHLLTIRPGDQQEMEDAQEMMKRIQEKWNMKGSSMSEEYDEILELLVELGVYASKYQRPGWYEDDLPAPPSQISLQARE